LEGNCKKNRKIIPKIIKMKVLLVTEYFPPKIFGGGEISAFNLAKNLTENEIEVDILTSKISKRKRIEQKKTFKIFRFLKTGKNPLKLSENLKRIMFLQNSLKKNIRKLDKKEKYDIIHFLNTTTIPKFKFKTNAKKIATFNSYTNFCPKRNMFYKEKSSCTGAKVTKCMSCLAKANFIGKYKTPFYLKYNPLFWIILYKKYTNHNKGLKNLDHYISISNYLTKLLIKEGINKEKISKIPNLISIEDNNKFFKIKDKEVTITYIGSLEKIKGVEILIKSFNKLKNNNTELVILGDGSQKENLKNISGKNIKFYDNIDYEFIPSIYRQSDIIIQPAIWPEPLSRVLLEATYFEKPIIATKNGGNPEGVINKKNGFIIFSEKELKKRLNELIKNKNLRKKQSIESKKIYNKKFNSKKIIAKILNIYKNDRQNKK